METEKSKAISCGGCFFSCLLISGALLFSYSVFNGSAGIYTSIVDGWKTRNWVSTTSTWSDAGSESGAPIWWYTKTKRTALGYRYLIDEIYYYNSDYDVHGPEYIGTEKEVSHFRNQGPYITVYYNPENREQSVLKKGMSFDKRTLLRIFWGSIGFMMTFIGAIPLFRSSKHATAENLIDAESQDD